MEDTLYIVIWKGHAKDAAWKTWNGGVFAERRLAENLIECLKAAGEDWNFAIVSGPVTNPQQMIEAELALGKF